MLAPTFAQLGALIGQVGSQVHSTNCPIQLSLVSSTPPSVAIMLRVEDPCQTEVVAIALEVVPPPAIDESC